MNDTLQDAKKQLVIDGIKGTNCPCCGQYVRLYNRKLNSGMALFLVGLYRLDRKTPKGIFSNEQIYGEVNVAQGARDHGSMKHWGLIDEPNIAVPNHKKKNGLWMLTDLGRNFAENKIVVPSHVRIYNKKSRGFSKSNTTLSEALGNKFNYQQLMK